MSAADDPITREAERGVMVLEQVFILRDMGRALLPSARAGSPKAVRLMRETVARLHRLGVSGPPLVALLTEEV